VIIDRTPDHKLLPASGDWSIQADQLNFPWSDLNPNDFEQMTRDVKPVTPSQTTLLAQNVEQIMPSRFAAGITIGPLSSGKAGNKQNSPPAAQGGSSDDDDEEDEVDQSQLRRRNPR
jgi:hypothetical protein